MHLLNLPVEIGSLIFTYLDTKSKLNTYSITELRHFFAPCVMKKVDITRSSLASVESLNLEVFHNFAAHIQELNLSGVPDLTAEKLSPCIRRFTSLKTLDVTFTKICLPDLENICCDTLKNIGVNFLVPWVPPWVPPRRIDEAWTKISNFFIRQQFERIHFVVLYLHYTESTLKFMKCVPLTKDLKITVDIYNRSSHTFSRDMEYSVIDIHFQKLCCVLHWGLQETYIRWDDWDEQDNRLLSRNLKGISNLDYSKIEYIFIMYSKTKQVTYIYASPIFSTMLIDNFSSLKIKLSPHLPLDFELTGHIIFKAWKKNLTIFNENFFQDLLRELLDYFPTYFCTRLHTPMKVGETPNRWCCLDSCGDFDELPHLPEYVSISNLCRRTYMNCNSPITLKPTMNSFKNVTFLSLSNICFKRNFFALLFMQCEMLYTLDFSFPGPEPDKTQSKESEEHCMMPMLNSLHLIKNLKNLKVTSGEIPYAKLFSSLCIRATLENLHICETDRYSESFEFDRSCKLITVKCCNLYSLFIESAMDLEELYLEFIWKGHVKNLRKEHIYVQVCCVGCAWNPFGDIFNPSPLFITQ